MTMAPAIRDAALATTATLAEHRRLLLAVLDHFHKRSEVAGGFVSGSLAAGGMDQHSDLDLGFLCRDGDARAALWEARWDWNIAPWFHRFDADHIKPYFVIYLFEPAIKADIHLTIVSDLPADGGAPYVIAWDDSGAMASWAERMNRARPDAVDWSLCVHDEERFWAWAFYLLQHVRRGEYYDVAADLGALRQIVETWHARLAGVSRFITRRVETRESPTFVAELAETFARPDRASLKRALRALIRLHDRQRIDIDALHAMPWRTAAGARVQITRMVEDL